MDGNGGILTDRDLHCIARTIQDMLSEKDTKCMYCRYAFQCIERHETTGKTPFVETWDKLQEMTGVKIKLFNPGTMQKDIPAGSWIEGFPELLGQFTNMSFEGQLHALLNPDILRYSSKCSNKT